MIGGADDDRVDLAVHLIKHLAEIFELLGLGESFEGLCRVAVVNVAQGDDVLVGHAIDVGGAATTDADCSDVQLLVGLGRICRPAV